MLVKDSYMSVENFSRVADPVRAAFTLVVSQNSNWHVISGRLILATGSQLSYWEICAVTEQEEDEKRGAS